MVLINLFTLHKPCLLLSRALLRTWTMFIIEALTKVCITTHVYHLNQWNMRKYDEQTSTVNFVVLQVIGDRFNQPFIAWSLYDICFPPNGPHNWHFPYVQVAPSKILISLLASPFFWLVLLWYRNWNLFYHVSWFLCKGGKVKIKTCCWKLRALNIKGEHLEISQERTTEGKCKVFYYTSMLPFSDIQLQFERTARR